MRVCVPVYYVGVLPENSHYVSRVIGRSGPNRDRHTDGHKQAGSAAKRD